MKDIIMAVDESISSTGVAIFSGTEFVTTYRICPEGKKPALNRMDDIYDSLREIAKRHKVSVFVAEDVYESKRKRSFLSFRYNLFIQGMLFALSKQKKNSIYALYPASQWRSILEMNATDDREGSKRAAKEYVRRTLGVELECDDEADAVCLGLAYIKEWS